MSSYEPVIGLEVHVELSTKSKMFCACSADYFGKEPNTQTCPVCLGLPGSLPYINKQAIESCIKIGLALNCEVNPRSLFERKNYFYPDLPKGYQISQYRWPLTINGWIEVENDKGEVSKIRINRAHQEEDTGKLTHQGSETLIDYNRSTVPLVEVVTEPDFTDSSQIKDYAKKLQQIFRYLEVSEADMEKGQMRLEANISVKRKGESGLPPYRVELKNINSFKFMVAAVEYEIKRQIEAHEKGEKLVQETRGWNEEKNETFTQRVKEEANDYRYFPEPDLPAMEFLEDQMSETPAITVNQIKSVLPELPMQKVAKYVKWGVKLVDAKIIVDDQELAEFFERAVEYGKAKQVEPIQIANYIINQKIDLIDSAPDQVVDDLIAKRANTLDDEAELEKLAQDVIDANPGLVDSFKAGKTGILMALVGIVMRKTGGKANAEKVKQILERLLI